MLPLFLEIISALTETTSLFLKALIFRLKSLRGYYLTIYVNDAWRLGAKNTNTNKILNF